MAAETSFDYYYGDESNQFSFYRIPRQLVTGERFKRLSMDAKLLYGLLLDRMSLSAKNGWYDEQGHVYIYYTLDEIQEDLNCGHDKATRMLVELDNGKNGFGLIERVRQGQGRPTKIYVKRFTTRAVPPPPPGPAPEPSPRPRIFSGQDCGKAAPSYIKSNQTDFSYTDPSILPSGSPPGMGWMDRLEQRREVDEAIGYAPSPYVTWKAYAHSQFKDFAYGNYFGDKESAGKDFRRRVEELRQDYGLPPKSRKPPGHDDMAR